MEKRFLFGCYGLCLAILYACGGSNGSISATATELTVSGVVATEGIFDPSPQHDGAGNLWMSYSTVNYSASDAALTQVLTRVASSPDGGSTWTDAGVSPNNNPNPDFTASISGSNYTATWRYEVSSLLFDPDDIASRRWKMLWHRYPTVDIRGTLTRVFTMGWIGLSTAPAPGGPWSTERKLFTGLWYDSTVDAIIGAPEYPLSTLYPALGQLPGCAIFTEPSMLAKPDGIYISLQCAGSPAKIVGLKCDRPFSSCTYRGDFLNESEASQFNQGSQALNGFGATEMVSVGSKDYLIVTPYEPPEDRYRGCLVFQVSDLATASLVRSNGNPVVVKRVSGTSGSFNGACGYDSSATGSGIIYSEYNNSAPHFRLFASHVTLP